MQNATRDALVFVGQCFLVGSLLGVVRVVMWP
jgi:hypothetical protein